MLTLQHHISVSVSLKSHSESVCFTQSTAQHWVHSPSLLPAYAPLSAAISEQRGPPAASPHLTPLHASQWDSCFCQEAPWHFPLNRAIYSRKDRIYDSVDAKTNRSHSGRRPARSLCALSYPIRPSFSGGFNRKVHRMNSAVFFLKQYEIFTTGQNWR